MTGEPDIVVHRCDVTVVRGGGWSWGPAPRDLVRRVVEALPGLLTAHLDRDEHLAAAVAAAGRLPDPPEGGSVEVTEPVRIVVSLSLADLVAGRIPLTNPTPSPTWATPAAASPAQPDATVNFEPAAVTGGAPDSRRDEPGHRPEPLPPAAGGARAEEPSTPGTAASPAAAEAPSATAPPGTVHTGRPAGVRMGEIEVGSVLPFLVASALHRIGLLEPIAPTLGPDPADARAFAVGLAYKVLPPPRLGWRREPADVEAAAAFAGLTGPVPDDALAGLARRAPRALAALDDLLARTVCRGHSPGRPLFVAAAGDGLLLVEPEGLFPVAWTDDAASLVPYWEACGRPLVLAGDGAAVDALAHAGVPLVTGDPPARGEAWRRLRGAGRRWVAGPVEGRLALRAAAADLTDPAIAVRDLVAGMAERRAVPRATHPGLERTLTLLAAAGLGTIAWLLWRHREPTDPQLALARLGDLGGLVRFEAGEVRVRLPYGRRHDDLGAHGLLTDVPGVSWLDGRTLVFGRG